MYIDSLLRVSDAQALTATAVSTNAVDLADATNPNRDLADGVKVRAVITATTAFASASGNATITFEIVTDTVAALSSPTVIGQSEPIAESEFAALPAKQIVVEMNPDIGSLGERFLGINYVVGVEDLTAGAVTADFVLEYADGQKYYPSGFTVS